MRISDWSSDVCSSDLVGYHCPRRDRERKAPFAPVPAGDGFDQALANHHLQRLGGSRLSKAERRDTLADRCRIARHEQPEIGIEARPEIQDRKSTRLNSSN